MTEPMSLRDRAALVALAKVVGEAIKDGDVQARSTVLTDLLSMWEETGVKSLIVRLPGTDTKVATITLTEPKDRAVIDDPQALLAWVEANRPDEVVTTTAIRSSFEKWLLDNVTLDDECCLLVDKETGESVEIPGLSVREAGKPTTFSLRFEPDGRELVRQAALGGASLAPLLEAGS